MDFGTIITILIIIGSFIYSTVQNYKEQEKQRPGKQKPAERDDKPSSPFEDIFPEPKESKKEAPKGQPTETEDKPMPHESQKPEPTPFEEPDPFTSQSDDFTPPGGEREGGQKPRGSDAYQTKETYDRPSQEAFKRKEKQSYKRPKKQAYQKQKSKAYSNQGLEKQRQHETKKIQRHVKQFDPVAAVMYSDILNRPKYLDEDVPPIYDRSHF